MNPVIVAFEEKLLVKRDAAIATGIKFTIQLPTPSG